MAVEVTMPKLGLNMKEGQLTEWLVEDRQTVREGQPIFVVETDKVTNEVEAEADGVLRHVAEPGANIEVAGLVGYILAEGEEMPTVEERDKEAREEPAGEEEPTPTDPKHSPAGRGPLATPAAKRRARELDVDLDKVTAAAAGDRLSVEDVERFAGAPEEAAEPEPPRVRATPVARRLAEQEGIDLATIAPAEGRDRVSKEDVEKAVAAREVGAAAEVADVRPLSGVRATIAERMHRSVQQTAPVTLTREVDASRLVRAREQVNREREERDEDPITYNDILVKLSAVALSEFDYMNARLVEDEIHVQKQINVGVAVETERGLLVPVVRQADQKRITEIGPELSQLVEKALEGKSLLDELSGGTFTVTNLGYLGIEAFTPIINYPEAAILGVGRIVQKPVVEEGGIFVRDRVSLSLTFNHRLVDGAPAARFLGQIAELIETLSPESNLW